MKPISTGIIGAALLTMTAVSAQADCAAELALLTGEAGATGGISKDGSLAPLESASGVAVGSGGAPATNNAAPTASASTNTAIRVNIHFDPQCCLDGRTRGEKGPARVDGLALIQEETCIEVVTV